MSAIVQKEASPPVGRFFALLPSLLLPVAALRSREPVPRRPHLPKLVVSIARDVEEYLDGDEGERMATGMKLKGSGRRRRNSRPEDMEKRRG